YNSDPAANDFVMRLNADGTRDTTFNAGGAGADGIVVAVAVQPDGKIVIGGFFTSYNGDTAAPDYVMRLLSDSANNPPTITAATGLSRQQGATANSQIATVTDDGGNGNVTVTVTSANPSNGVTISNIVNTAGNITADIAAD